MGVERTSRLLGHWSLLLQVGRDRLVEIDVLIATRRLMPRALEVLPRESGWTLIDFGPYQIGLATTG